MTYFFAKSFIILKTPNKDDDSFGIFARLEMSHEEKSVCSLVTRLELNNDRQNHLGRNSLAAP